MIDSVIPLGATAQQDGVELGVTWLLVGDDWVAVDFATRGTGGYAHLGIMPTLDPTTGPLLVRAESAGGVVTEVELPLDGPTLVVDSP